MKYEQRNTLKLAAALAAALPAAARAQVVTTWTGASTTTTNVNANWNNGGNWDAGAKPTDVARFAGAFGSTTGNVANNGAQAINQILYDGVTNAFALNTATNAITLNAGGAAGGVGIVRRDGAAAAAATQTINTGLVLGASQTFDIGGAAGQLTISGVIAETPGGAKDLVKIGSRPLELNGANTYTGQTTVLRNTLIVGNAQALGTGNSPLLVGDPAAVNTQSNVLLKTGLTFSRDVVVRSGSSGTATLGGNANAVSTWAGSISLKRPIRLTGSTNAAGVIDFTGVIQDAPAGVEPANPFVSSDVTKVDPSTVKLSAANTYSGTTTISAGRLEVNGSLGDSASPVVVNAGGTLGGGGTISRPVHVTAGGALAPGTGDGSGRLTIAGGRALTFDPGAVLEWKSGATPDTSPTVSASLVAFADGGAPALRVPAGTATPDPAASYLLLSWTGPDPVTLPEWTIDPATAYTGILSYVGGADGLAGGSSTPAACRPRRPSPSRPERFRLPPPASSYAVTGRLTGCRQPNYCSLKSLWSVIRPQSGKACGA